MNKSIILFDLDGTLADNEHRQHYVSNEDKEWDMFFAEQINDRPNHPIIELFKSLKKSNKNPLFIITARPERYREKTTEWLAKYQIFPERLVMRKDGDRRSDVIVKKEMLSNFRLEGMHPLFVVDDRTSVVKMWREEGVTCLQCADHNY